VPEVSISMYTAWVWLRWSVQVDTDNPSSDAKAAFYHMPHYAARLTERDSASLPPEGPPSPGAR